KRYVAAVGFFTDVFAAEPKLAADLDSYHRYNAACAAALAAAGKGEDARGLGVEEWAWLQQKAHDWLRADLAAYAPLVEKGDAATRQAVRQRLAHWQQDADLAAVRDKDWLDAMPEADRKRWQQLWADVEALRERAVGKE